MKSISGREFSKVLERHDWALRTVRGSHHVYCKAGRPERISVPIHGNRDLKLGLLRQLMKLAGLSENDL